MVPFDPAVVAPWRLGEGNRGALLVHGFAGTPPELRRLGEHLAAHGWRCHAPALAGHGTTPEDHERSTRRDWLASARAALDELDRLCPAGVCVAGQSMGGTVTLHLAATEPRVRAVAALATPIWVNDRRLRWLAVLKRLRRWHVPEGAVDLADPAAIEELHSYGRRSTRAIHEFVRLLGMVEAELAMVRAPVLLLHGGGDTVVDPANMAAIARRLVCSARVETELFPQSGHGMSVDVDREAVNARVLAWFDRHLPATAAGARAPAVAATRPASPPG